MADMRHGSSVRSALLIIALALPSVAAADVWDEAYHRGLDAIKAENYAVAVGELQRAIADAPDEFISEQQPRNGWTAYLPHYFLGVAKFHTGDYRGAMAEWKISEKQGVVLKNAHYAEELRNWMAHVSAEIELFEAFGRASSAQADAIAAGADGGETYRKARRVLQESKDTYSKAEASTDSFRRAFNLASEARTLFAAAAAEAKKPLPTQPRPASPPIRTPPLTATTGTDAESQKRAFEEAVRRSMQAEMMRLQTEHELKQKQPKNAPVPAPPAPITTSTAPGSFPADEQLRWEANIAFNTPDQIDLDEHRVIKLLLDLHRPVKELEQQLGEGEKTATATIKISDSVEARLTGAAFDIRPISPELQAVSADETTEWQWEVTPKQEGSHRLFLTVNAILGSGAKRSIRTFDRIIEVRVPPRGTGKWIVPISVLAGVAVVLLLLFALRHRTRPAVTQPTVEDTVPVGKTTLQTPVRSSSYSTHFREHQVIGERYRIVRLLGQGGMGAVYAAEDGEFGGELVALKTILAPGQDADHLLARFKKEIQLARRVAHPNVCRIFDVGYHVTGPERAIFVSMEYITGVPLKTLIQQKGRLNEREALAIIRDVAAALDATHAAGLIHRDVKSANVMLAEGDRAVLMDFGLACLSNPDEGELSLTKTGAIIGTPAYMAPEQIEGNALTAATDIYAFGMVIYEMVTGRLPYEGDTPMNILAKRLREPPRSPAQFVPNLKVEWEQAILRCLEHEPSKRFQRAMDVSRALDDAADMPTHPDVTQLM